MSAPAQPATAGTGVQETPLPSATALLQAAKLAIAMDRSIQLDYYADSVSQKAIIGEDEGEAQDKLLIKSRHEYTSLIKKIYKADTDYIVLTENSIYIVSTQIKKKKIKHSSLAQEEA